MPITMPRMEGTLALPLQAALILDGDREALMLAEIRRKSIECHLFNGAVGEDEVMKSDIGEIVQMRLLLH